MKKVIVISLVMFGLPLAVFLGRSMSQDRGSFRPPSPLSKANPFSSRSGQYASPTELTVEQHRIMKIKNTYLELMKAHVETLTEDELLKGIAHIRSRQKEAEAKKKMNQAIDLLKAIVNDTPESPTAARARLMLSHQIHRHDDHAADLEAAFEDPAKIQN